MFCQCLHPPSKEIMLSKEKTKACKIEIVGHVLDVTL